MSLSYEERADEKLDRNEYFRQASLANLDVLIGDSIYTG
jgi:hypothetical protein